MCSTASGYEAGYRRRQFKYPGLQRLVQVNAPENDLSHMKIVEVKWTKRKK